MGEANRVSESFQSGEVSRVTEVKGVEGAHRVKANTVEREANRMV